MVDIKFNYNNALSFVSKEKIQSYQQQIDSSFEKLYNKNGKGNDFLGWMDLPDTISNELIEEIETLAKKIRSQAQVYVVIGIGGSYLGSRAVIEALAHHFVQLKKSEEPVVLFAGQNISEDYLNELLEILDNKDYCMTVISKSGTTTEPAIAFRILKNHMTEKYGEEETKSRITAITDKEKGALKQLSNEEGYETFVVPDDVGGRYSVLTPVGLLPIAVAGFSIREMLDGAKKMKNFLAKSTSISSNPVSAYAAARNALYTTGKTTEIMVNYEPRLFYFTEWWKQLYGESEGKEGKGIFPAGVGFTADLHSMGQYIQEGLRNIFETVVSVKKPDSSLSVPRDPKNLDGLNYIAGKALHEVNHQAEIGTTLAHIDGGVPNLSIEIPQMTANVLGQLIYFFEMACAVSGYVLDVNPFDQPGVEAYKKNMFALLGKPGFEKETAAIRKRIS